MARPKVEYEPLLSPAEVAEMFRVSTTTVSRWANAGRIRVTYTPGGHRRYYESEIRKMLKGA